VKKFLLILLLTILPLQYSWAAAAVYCKHEQGSSTHFGHHSHQHKAQVDEPDGEKKSKEFHGDCEYCHMFSHAYLLQHVADFNLPPKPERTQTLRLTFSSHIPDSPKRPDWVLVA
jgi:hypothetical protein